MFSDTVFDERVLKAINACISPEFILQTVIDEAEITLKTLSNAVVAAKGVI